MSFPDIEVLFQNFRNVSKNKRIQAETRSKKVEENSELLVRFFRDATANNASVQVIAHNFSWNKSRADRRPHPHVTIAPFTERAAYVAAMHELGHLVGPWQDFQKNTLLEMEAGAWKWARENIYDWCIEDGKMRRQCLQTYFDGMEQAKSMGLTRHPDNNVRLLPEPPADHYLWQCMKSDMA